MLRLSSVITWQSDNLLNKPMTLAHCWLVRQNVTNQLGAFSCIFKITLRQKWAQKRTWCVCQQTERRDDRHAWDSSLFISLGEVNLSQTRQDLALESDRPVFTFPDQLSYLLALRWALSVKKRCFNSGYKQFQNVSSLKERSVLFCFFIHATCPA